ncbi:DUF1761 domain-containing protein [Candidatus Kaiserbacteria bacterium]|nr:DUF1761 domain-containing protein [Candidatus Kaiserbacteria bacterium]
METLILDVNWMAVFIGTAASFLLGWLWYSPKMFGVKWAKGVGVDIEDSSGPQKMAMAAQLGSTFLLAWVIGVTETTDSLVLAVLVILMAAGLIKANGLFAQKSIFAIGVETMYIIVMGVVMIMTHAFI